MTIRCLRLPLLLLAAATTACAGARAARGPDAGVQTADSLVASWIDAARIPGAVLLVSQDDSTVLDTAYGWAELSGYGQGQYGDWSGGPGADAPGAPGRGSAAAATPDTTVHPGIHRLAHPVPMTTATVFDLASVTKVMATTFAVMMLVDEGKLGLDAPLHTYLPDFRGPEKDRITLRMLLTHRAGLYQWQPIFYHASNEREAYAYIRDLPLHWKPGEGRHYSDLGFMLLGLVVERVSGLPLDTFLHDRLYGPLGLAYTGFRRADEPGPFAATSLGNPYEFRMVHDTTFGYRYAGDPDAWNGWRHRTLLGEVNDGNAYHAFGGVAGHAGLFSTTEDLDVLLQVLLHKGEYRGRRYVRAATVDTFMTPTGDGQALGWQVPSDAPAGSFDHTGFTGTYVLGVPARGLAVVLLTNRQNLGVDALTRYPDVAPLRRAVAEALLRPN